MVANPEVIYVPGVLGIGNELGEAVIAELVAREQLPRDVYFRSLALDPETRLATLITDVKAAAGLGQESAEAATYLHGPLPDCVYVPEPAKLRDTLVQIDDDYYRRYDLYPNPENLDDRRQLVCYTWQRLVQHLNPSIYEQVADVLHPVNVRQASRQRRNYAQQMLGRTVIRDEALFGIYATGTNVRGIGPEGRELIRTMLTDNHPNLLQPKDYE